MYFEYVLDYSIIMLKINILLAIFRRSRVVVGQMITCDVHFVIQAPNQAFTSIISRFNKKKSATHLKFSKWPPKSKMATKKLGQVALSSKL